MPCVPRQSSCRQLSTRKHEGLGAVLTWVSVLAVLFTGSVTANYLLNLSEPLFSLWRSGEQGYHLCRMLRISNKGKKIRKGMNKVLGMQLASGK